MLVAWNETRETRRAVVDALPLLKRARCVTVGTVVHDVDLEVARTRLADVAHWPAGHGVVARQVAVPRNGDDADALWALGQNLDADLMIAGAYGHGRLHELVMGGVTKNLLIGHNRYALLTH